MPGQLFPEPHNAGPHELIAFRTPWKVDIVSKVGAIAGDALFEIDRFRRTTGCEIKPLTVREILDEEIAAT